MMTPRPIAMLALLTLVLAGCGSRQHLAPAPGETLPVAAYGAEKPATPDELLTPSTQARPERNVELLRRSQRREPDPFDMPPD